MAFVGIAIGCRKTPSGQPENAGVLALKGPIPGADGGVAMQRGDQYGELRFGHAVLHSDDLFVFLSGAEHACDDWPRRPELSIMFHLSAGPDGDFFAGRVVTAH